MFIRTFWNEKKETMKNVKGTIIKKSAIKNLDKVTIKRYNERFQKFGIEPRTLGWGCKKDQLTRFEAATNYINFSGRSVLDIGCGFADFYEFLLKKDIKIKKYKGIDINKNLIKTAKKRFPKNKYGVRNVLLDNYKRKQADIIILLGLLNFKLNNLDNLAFSKKMIKAAWEITKETLIVDFLSSYLTKDYPREDSVYYHHPCNILKFALKLSDNVVLFHDYLPIPQKEFMIILKRK